MHTFPFYIVSLLYISFFLHSNIVLIDMNISLTSSCLSSLFPQSDVLNG